MVNPTWYLDEFAHAGPEHLDDAVRTIQAWLAVASTRPRFARSPEELETHLRDEYSTFSWLLEPMLTQAGFAIQARTSASKIYADYVCVKEG